MYSALGMGHCSAALRQVCLKRFTRVPVPLCSFIALKDGNLVPSVSAFPSRGSSKEEGFPHPRAGRKGERLLRAGSCFTGGSNAESTETTAERAARGRASIIITHRHQFRDRTAPVLQNWGNLWRQPGSRTWRLTAFLLPFPSSQPQHPTKPGCKERACPADKGNAQASCHLPSAPEAGQLLPRKRNRAFGVETK